MARDKGSGRGKGRGMANMTRISCGKWGGGVGMEAGPTLKAVACH